MVNVYYTAKMDYFGCCSKLDLKADVWFASGLAAVYGYFIYYDAALMMEIFFNVLVLLTLYLSIELKENPTLMRWVRLGLSLGLAALLRQTVLLFAPFLRPAYNSLWIEKGTQILHQ